MGGRGPLPRRRRRAPRRDVRDLRAAAERHRRAPHGPRAERLDAGLPDPLAPHARLRHALAAGLRPRGHLDPERGREAADRRGHLAPGDRPRGVPRAHLGLARAHGQDDHGPVPPARLLARLLARALHDGRRVRRRRDDVLRPALGGRLDLPREPDRQLVPVPPDRDLRPRGRARRDGRRADLRPVPVRRRLRLDHDRHRPAGDDPGRRRRGGASRRPALSERDRQGGRRAGRRAARARDRRRARRAGVRLGRAEDHAGARSEGLRDRPRSRPGDDHGDRAGRPHDRRGLRGARSGRCGRASPRLAEGARPAREARELPARGRHLRALPLADRAARLAAVVVPDGRARGARDRGAPSPPRPASTPRASTASRSSRSRTRRTGASPGSSGGAIRSRSGPVRTVTRPAPGRRPTPARSAARRRSSARRTFSTRGSRPPSGRSPRSAGRRRRPSSTATTPATSTSRRARSSASGRTG